MLTRLAIKTTTTTTYAHYNTCYDFHCFSDYDDTNPAVHSFNSHHYPTQKV